MGRFRLLVLYVVGFPKTLYVNCRLLPFKQAIKLPIVVSHKTKIKSLSGKARFDKIKCARLKIGFGSTPTTDFRTDRNTLHVKGELIVNGKARFGAGSKIHIHPNARLEIGDNFNMTGRSTLVCKKRIAFGTHVLISWEVQIMDTDQHEIMNSTGSIINPDQPITIGSDVWICSRATVLKGVSIANNTVIASGSVVSKSCAQTGVILAGSPAKIIKEDISWN